MTDTLILLHGAGPAGRMWRRSAERLRDEFKVLTPDLVGFGRERTPSDPHFTNQAAVDAIAELIAANGGKAHVCGLSLGANVAIGLAASHPELVDRLMLCAPALRPARNQLRWIRFYRRLPWFAVRMFADVPDRATWLAFVDDMESTDLTGMLPQISAPTLVICGARDRGNMADARIAAEAIDRATFLRLPHCGHIWPATKPDLFDKVTRGFLDV